MTLRRLRLGILTGLAGMAGLLTLLPPVVPSAGAQTTAPEVLPLTVTIGRLTPTAPQPGELLTVTGTVSNPASNPAGTGSAGSSGQPSEVPSEEPTDHLSVVLRIALYPEISRSQLGTDAGDSSHFDSNDAGLPVDLGPVPPGSRVPYTLAVPIDQLKLTTPGVYRISVEVFHTVDEERVYDGRVNTFLPWLPPSAAVAPVRVAWLWPLLSTPHLETDNTFTDDNLGTEVTPTGRLGRLLAVAAQVTKQSGTVPVPLPLTAGPNGQAPTSQDPVPTPIPIRPVPVTPVVDPETVQELQLMADKAHPYQVNPLDSTAPTTPGVHSDAATAYLAGLLALMQQNPSIAVPYADPDIEALTRANAPQLVTGARSTGLEAGLPGIVPGLLWPPDGALSAETLDGLITTGLVLSDLSYPLAAGTVLDYTPTAATTVPRAGGTVPAVVIDAGLSQLVTKQIHGGDQVLATQRYAAETAQIALDGGPSPRTLLIAPQRRWSSTNTAVRALLSETGSLPWVTPTTVPKTLAEDPTDPNAPRGPLHQPAVLASLPNGLAERIATTNEELAGFRSILCPVLASSGRAATTSTGAAPTSASAGGTQPSHPAGSAAPSSGAPVRCDPEALVLDLQRSIFRAGSTAFRVPSSGGEALLANTQADLVQQESKVRITTSGEDVLVGSQARVPIRIVNELTVPVRVQVRLTSPSLALRTPKAEFVTIQPGQPAQVNITVTTARAGAAKLPVDAQLLTPTGRPYGPPARITIKVSVYGAIVVWISIAVAGLLVLAVIVRIYRRIRNARRGGGPEPETTGTPSSPGPAEATG